MASKGIARIIFLCCVIFCSVKAYGFPAECRDVKVVADEADIVVRGEVVKTEAQESQPGKIQTFVTIRVDEYIKGEGKAFVMLKVPGGCVQGLCMQASGTPSFRMGEKGYLCLREPEGNEYDEGRFFSPVCGRGMIESLE